MPPPPVLHLAELTWTEVRDLGRERLVAILPTGAVEAHGPHLPLSTDGVIAGAMAEAGAALLAAAGWTPLILPPLDYTAAGFARAFPGTVSVRPETETALVVDIGSALAAHGVGVLAIANAHLDPEHLGALLRAAEELEQAGTPRVAFPDLTRRPWALRLTDEFKSGACHAGRYEGSVVLAERPELVRTERAAALPPNPSSLTTAIRDGKQSFAEAGGPEAYFGDPAAATAEEGRRTIEVLGRILRDAVELVVPSAGIPDETDKGD